MASILNIAEFCEHYRVARSTFYRQGAAGALPCFKIGRTTYIRKTDAAQWAAQKCSIAKDSIVPYTGQRMVVSQTRTFQTWFDDLRDRQAQKHILVRIGRLERGNFGDVKPIGEGVSELRIHHGAGYRLYLKRKGDEWVLLLCGGDKDSQARDIKRAKQLAKEIET